MLWKTYFTVPEFSFSLHVWKQTEIWNVQSPLQFMKPFSSLWQQSHRFEPIHCVKERKTQGRGGGKGGRLPEKDLLPTRTWRLPFIQRSKLPDPRVSTISWLKSNKKPQHWPVEWAYVALLGRRWSICFEFINFSYCCLLIFLLFTVSVSALPEADFIGSQR